ncbi:MAG: beta-ketoacyl synthase N-terminal-like domain-containing protein [Candidatus Melainabacteria bacterium]|nr:beta-ketoacyl synthase N-terminal-like domain-containing protein [Candidatus Melainabacteria bacterium]
MQDNRVLITGIGPVTPSSIGVTEFSRAAFQGEQGNLQKSTDARGKSNRVFRVDRQALSDEAARLKLLHGRTCGVRPNSLNSLKASFVAAHHALEDSAVISPTRSRIGDDEAHKTSIFFAAPPEFLNIGRFFERLAEPGVQRHLAEDVGSYVSTELSRIFGAKGIVRSINACCSSTLTCLDEAFRYLKDGTSDLALCGSVDMDFASVTEGFDDFGILLQADQEYSPLDQGNSGLRLGEGAGALVLERLEHVKQRGALDKVYAELLASASFADAADRTLPNGEGLERSILSVLEQANISPADIDFVQVHGSGNKKSDELEIRVLRKIFGDHLKDMKITANKSRYGHSMINAGFNNIAELSISLKEDQPTPTTGIETPRDPDFPLYKLGDSYNEKSKYGIALSMGFGGINNCVLLKKWDKATEV